MTASILHEQREEFDERNLVAQVALGALSLGAQLDALLERHAPDRGNRGAQVAPDDATAAVLGLIALRRAVGRLLDEAAATVHEIPASLETDPEVDGRWLR